MKKYLMTGVAALAFAATFTSCSKTDLYDENKVEQEKKPSKIKTFFSKFKKKKNPQTIDEIVEQALEEAQEEE